MVVFASSSQSAGAYHVQAFRWDHSCFTHEANAELTAALAKWAAVSGVTDCGVTEHPDLRVLPNSAAIGSAAIAGATPARFVDGVAWIDHCDITFQKGYDSDPVLWTHETGHCLALDHTDVPHSVMQSSQPVPATSFPQPDDIAAIQSLYGPRTTPLAFRYPVSVAADAASATPPHAP